MKVDTLGVTLVVMCVTDLGGRKKRFVCVCASFRFSCRGRVCVCAFLCVFVYVCACVATIGIAWKQRTWG